MFGENFVKFVKRLLKPQKSFSRQVGCSWRHCRELVAQFHENFMILYVSSKKFRRNGLLYMLNAAVKIVLPIFCPWSIIFFAPNPRKNYKPLKNFRSTILFLWTLRMQHDNFSKDFSSKWSKVLLVSQKTNKLLQIFLFSFAQKSSLDP